MRMREYLLPLLMAVLVASCGGGDDAVGPGKPVPPTVSYSPDPADTVIVVIPDSVVLSVSVSPPQPFTAEFTVGDSVVATGSELVILGQRVAETRYRVVVNVEGEWYFDKDWDVRIVTEIERPTPAPTAPVAGPGELPGTIAVVWNRPADHLVDPEAPLEGYEVAWSSVPFSQDAFHLQDTLYVPSNPAGIAQSADISDLIEREQYYVRVRTIDVLGRASWPTSEVISEATGSFTLTGNVWQLDATGWPTPVSSALVVAGPARVTTIEDGRFVLPGLPDLEALVLTAEEGSGLYTLPIQTTPLETVDRNLDLVLVPRQNVDVLDRGVVSSATLREFLLQATLHERGLPPYEFHPWAEYPVKVWVWEYAVPDSIKVGTEDSYYHEAFATAIDLWNDGAEGEQRLLEYVPVERDFDPTELEGVEGIMVRLYDTPPPWPNLGEARFERPAGGKVSLSTPELMSIYLRPNFLSQSLAERIIAHELGHVLGLIHTMSESNLMHVTADLADGVPTPEEIFVARYIRHGGPDMLTNWIIDP